MVVVMRTPTPNYLRQASQNLGKYSIESVYAIRAHRRDIKRQEVTFTSSALCKESCSLSSVPSLGGTTARPRDENKARTRAVPLNRARRPGAPARARCRASRPTIARRGSDPRRHAQIHEHHLAHASSSSLKVQEDEEEASRDACHPWPSVRCSAQPSLFSTHKH